MVLYLLGRRGVSRPPVPERTDPVVLFRCQINNRLSGSFLKVTRDSSFALGSLLAPSPNLLFGRKNHRITHRRFQELYEPCARRMLEVLHTGLYDFGRPRGHLALACHCRRGWPCHADIIIDVAISNWPGLFRDGRPQVMDWPDEYR